MKINIAIVAIVTAAVATQSAAAADLPAMPAKTPAVVVAQTWSGVYAGLTAGGVWSRAKDTFIDPSAPALVGQPIFDTKGSGFIGGATLGVNWQIGTIVLGVEGDFSGMNDEGDSTSLPPFAAGNKVEVRQRWLATARGRLGYAFSNLLVYGTGGIAWGIDVRQTITSAGAAAPGTDTKDLVGWTAGGGFEYKFGGSNWSAKAEYLYVNFDDKHFFGREVATGILQSKSLENHIARVGVNYSFAGLR
jgi:outer membrane immunogenic protein